MTLFIYFMGFVGLVGMLGWTLWTLYPETHDTVRHMLTPTPCPLEQAMNDMAAGFAASTDDMNGP